MECYDLLIKPRSPVRSLFILRASEVFKHCFSLRNKSLFSPTFKPIKSQTDTPILLYSRGFGVLGFWGFGV